jgi:hypothetical protein
MPERIKKSNSISQELPPLTLPTIDIADERSRHVIIAKGTPELYQGHADCELLSDGKTMFCVWSLNHGWGEPLLKRSEDAGVTWHEISVPANWNTWNKEINGKGSTLGREGRAWLPMIHLLRDSVGCERLFIFDRGREYMQIQAVSEDQGLTWTPMCHNGLHGIEPSMNIIASRDGQKLMMWNSNWANGIFQAESFDGGLTWHNERLVVDNSKFPGAQWIEPGVIRSPDESCLLMLIRDFKKGYNSVFSVSDNDGKTWSPLKRLTPELTGDRHCPFYALDGRLIVLMRDTLLNGSSPTQGHFIAWIGTWEDIIAGQPGQYRVKLLHDHPDGGDCGYSSAKILPDGTIVATTYIRYMPGAEYHSVVSTRFKLEELDQRLSSRQRLLTPLKADL